MSVRLVLVDDGVPRRSLDLLLGAASRSALTTHVVRASAFTFADASPLAPGDLLYRPAVSSAAIRVERFLFGPGVISFYVDVDGPYFDSGDPYELFARARIPTVQTVYCASRRRPTLEALIERVGGFPIVAKVPGGEGGIGVVRLDSRAALYSFVDFALGGGHAVQLMSFIGRPHVLEVNFPCFHAQAEVVAGTPVSDAMIRHLLDKRDRVLGVAP